MAERQSSHRQFIEKIVIIFDAAKSVLGVVFALVIVISGMVIGAYLVIHDKPISGFLSLLTPLSTVAVAFIIQKKAQERDDEKHK